MLRQAIQAVRKGGTVSIPGVYGGLLDKVPFGAAFGKGVTMKMGQTNMHNYMKPLLARIEERSDRSSYIISHRIGLDRAPDFTKFGGTKKRSYQDRDRPLGGLVLLAVETIAYGDSFEGSSRNLHSRSSGGRRLCALSPRRVARPDPRPGP